MLLGSKTSEKSMTNESNAKSCHSDQPTSQSAEPARFLTFTRHHAGNRLLGIEKPKAGVPAFLARNAKTTDKT